jgi:CheY-like chemotaxis protein/DNA-directed RNA polymerase specialized sigma24 family protein
MSQQTMSRQQTTDGLAHALPYLRRYARALTGSQTSGDNFAAAALEVVLADPSALDLDLPPKTALFRVFHGVWSSAGNPLSEADNDLSAAAQRNMANLTALSREALLLSSVENFQPQQVAQILGVDDDEAQSLVRIALAEMGNSIAGRVMIIEDESIIALDLSSIVEELGHTVTGNPRTQKAAIELASRDTPDLILADIHLADNSSGIDAVNEIRALIGDRPVIFITAYPERFLTGEKPEPAFLISKPYSEAEVRSTVSQAMFFASSGLIQI